MDANALLRFEPGLMIWTIAIFLTLLAVLRRYAWGPLLAALDQREKSIEDALQQAQETQQQTEIALSENRRLRDESLQRAEQIIEEAQQNAEQTRRQILDEAKEEAKKLAEQGLRRLEAEQRAVVEDIRKTTADLAVRAAARLIETSLTDEQQHAIVNKFLAEMPRGKVRSEDGSVH